MCYTGILSSVLCLTINTYYTGKLINVGFLMQMKDISVTLILSMTMYGLVFWVISMLQGDILKLFCGVIGGGLYFWALSVRLKMEELSYIKGLLKK